MCAAKTRSSRACSVMFHRKLGFPRTTPWARFGSWSTAGYSDMLALETRYNVTKKWDIGLHGALLHSWNSGQLDYSLGGDIGYLLMANAWVSLGYNLRGFEDKDFSAANYTAQGPYLRFRLKFDQETMRGLAAGLNSN